MNKNLFYFLSITGFLVLIFNIYSYSISYNLNVRNADLLEFSTAFIPQGWGFFTIDPKSRFQTNLYDSHGNKLIYQNSHYKYLFGFSKKGRKLSMETAIISERIPDSLWKTHSDLKDSTEIEWIKIESTNLHYLEQGRYIIERHKITPYLWRNLPKARPTKEYVYVETIEESINKS